MTTVLFRYVSKMPATSVTLSWRVCQLGNRLSPGQMKVCALMFSEKLCAVQLTTASVH